MWEEGRFALQVLEKVPELLGILFRAPSFRISDRDEK